MFYFHTHTTKWNGGQLADVTVYSSDDILGTWETAERTLFLCLRFYVRPVRRWVLPLARSEAVHLPDAYKVTLVQIKIFIYRDKKFLLYK